MVKKPTVLIILDGYGYRNSTDHNAVATAQTPNLHRWFEEYPHALLDASGRAVGLEDGVIGNSEVGHLTIGTGQVNPQPLTILNDKIKDESFFSDEYMNAAFKRLAEQGQSLHLIGLLSDAGVHAHINHLFAFIKLAEKYDIPHIKLHLILDGRDTPPKSAGTYIEQLQDFIADDKRIHIASAHGRFYAMDRDNNWERIQETLNVLLEPKATTSLSPIEYLQQQYQEGITDEFVQPASFDTNTVIRPGDGVVFFNFRPDRARQLTRKLLEEQQVSFFITPVSYHPDLLTHALIAKKPVTQKLIQQLIDKKKTIFTIAETEKYAHVTYFFNGGREEEYEAETRVLIPSIKSKDYAERPCMSADKITDAVLNSLQTNPCDFYLINYANADMVGHSGNLEATKQALECLDGELKRIYDQVITQMDGTIYITSDHGNAEEMADTSGTPKTSHTTNKVPFMMIQQNLKPTQLPLSGLKDIAPFILKNLK